MPKCDDPIECGHEAALGQWEARWEFVKTWLKVSGSWGASHDMAFGEAEQTIPVGLPVGTKTIPIMEGRITIQLEPERVTRLREVLGAAGAHPSGLGSYEAANDALGFAEDIANMADGQMGWTR